MPATDNRYRPRTIFAPPFVNRHHMNIPTTRTVAALALFSCGFVGLRAQTPVLRSEDTFAYSAGSLVGKSGGTGWSGAWTMPYGAGGFGGPLNVNASGVVVFGGSSGTTGIQSMGRVFDRTYSSATTAYAYITFEARIGTQYGGGTPSFRLFDSTVMSGGLGSNGGTGLDGNYSILDTSLQLAGPSANSGASMNSTLHLLYRVDYRNNTSSLWTSATAFDMANPPSIGASATAPLAPSFNRFEFLVRGLASFDNLRVYEVTLAAVPEPASAGALAGLAALGWVFSRRRRR